MKKLKLNEAKKLIEEIKKIKIIFNKEADEKDQFMDQFQKKK